MAKLFTVCLIPLRIYHLEISLLLYRKCENRRIVLYEITSGLDVARLINEGKFDIYCKKILIQIS